MTEKIFTNGLVAKRNEKAPDFVICNLAFKVTEFDEFMRQYSKNGWINVDVKLSKGGKMYGELNTYEKAQPSVESIKEDIRQNLGSNIAPEGQKLTVDESLALKTARDTHNAIDALENEDDDYSQIPF